MNRYQRAYDSYDKTNKLLKLTNSYYHFRNLELIKNRKPVKYSPEKIMHKRQTVEPFNDFFVKKENMGLKKKINEIRKKPVKAKINDIFLEKELKMKDFHRQYKYLDNIKRKKENEYYKGRIENQKAMIDIKGMEKNFDTKQAKYGEKLRKIGPGEDIVLPPIKNTHENPMFSETKKYFNTEANKSGDNDGNSSKVDKNASKINSSEDDNEEGEKVQSNE